MPLPTRDDVLAFLKDLTTNKTADDPAVVEMVAKLGEIAPPLHSAIFSAGYARGSTVAERKLKQGELADVTAERDELKTENGKLTQQVADLKTKAPDVATLQTQWEQRVREAEEKGAAALTKANGRLQAAQLRSARADFLRLAKDKGLNESYAAVEWEKAHLVDGRIKFAEDGQLDILEPHRKIPYVVAAEGDLREPAVLGVFVDELRKAAKPEMITATADAGADTGADRQAGPPSGIAEIVKGFQAQRNARPNPLAQSPFGPLVPVPAVPAAVPAAPAKAAASR